MMKYIPKKIIFGFLISLILFTKIDAQYLKRSGKDIVNDQGEKIILRAMGIGNWMLQEPYMINAVGAFSGQWEFKEKIETLIGEERTENFYENWLNNFVMKEDIDSLSSWGFNSVRLALHYNLFTLPIEEEPVNGENTWLTKGFELIDNVVSWCESNEIYVILDLHAAPGGQGRDSNISDRNPLKPNLWESDLNKSKTVALWGKIAERYKDTPWIGGYDLINETHWDLPNNNQALRDLYIRITNAIRVHDSKRILFIEGNGYANDFNGLTPAWDNNMAYSFHKYKTYNNIASLEFVLSIQNEFGYPLWMGEGGENSNAWNTDAVRLFEELEIGWAKWTYKRVESIRSPMSINSNNNYQNLIKYFKGEAEPPTVENAYQGLLDLAESTKISNSVYRKDYVDALIRQPHTNETIPFTSNNSVPGIIYASNFDLGNNLIAYYDVNSYDYEYSTGEYQPTNSFVYRNDGAEVNTTSYNEGNGYCLEFISKDEWAIYSIDVFEDGFYDIDIFYSSEVSSGKIGLEINEFPISSQISLTGTGSYDTFNGKKIEKVYMKKGIQKFKFIAQETAFDLSHFVFTKSSNQNFSNFNIVESKTGDDFKSINIYLNQPASTENIDENSFQVFKNIGYVNVNSIDYSSNNQILNLKLDNTIVPTDNIRVTYNLNNILSENGQQLEQFNLFVVENNSISSDNYFNIPSKIEAEDFHQNAGQCVAGNRGCGFRTENCSDFGGGLNLAYADIGDAVAYKVLVEKSGRYKVDFRIASNYSEGKLRLGFKKIQENTDLTNLSNNKLIITTPYTNGWQNWETVSEEIILDAGYYQFDLTVIKPEFNINWIEFSLEEEFLSNEDVNETPVRLYPNPSSSHVFIDSKYSIYNLKLYDITGKLIASYDVDESNKTKIYTDNLKKGIYILEINSSINKELVKLIKN